MSKSEVLAIIETVFTRYENERDRAYAKGDRIEARLCEAGLTAIGHVWHAINNKEEC